ncbi:MFS transporter [Mycoplasma tullyi]|uniref:MFS transporter n=1 Tax=Mycoplasma tullyi TaxID=1612150 RepID=A0A7D7Y4X1_9MOLU|nr:MFS transporter [Mycoplasma tullyi]QMT98477.1 MFS transporter [Mycoplasma tullyi]
MKLSLKSGLTREQKLEKISKVTDKELFITWMIILFGYFLFVVNWFLIDQVAGNFTFNPDGNDIRAGWSQSFFFKNPGSIATAATNWTITFFRGVGSFVAGWFIGRLGHRKTVLTMLALMGFSFPFIIVAFPFNGNALVLSQSNLFYEAKGDLISGGSLTKLTALGYSLFIIFRTLLAVGGTALISYTQPVIAKLSTIQKKSALSVVNPFGFNIGAAFSLGLFAYSRTLRMQAQESWYIVCATFIVIIFATFTLYFIFGKETVLPKDKHTKMEPEVTILSTLKDKKILKLCLMYGAWLVAVVWILTGTYANGVIGASPFNFIKKGETGGLAWVGNTSRVAFVLGLVGGLFLISPFNKTRYDRSTFLMTQYSLGILFVIVSFVFGFLGANKNEGLAAGQIIASFLAGVFLWGLQGTFLLIPHEFKGASPSKVGTQFGVLWGVGYMIYTLSDILLSVVVNAPGLAGKDFTGQLNPAGITAFVMYVVIAMIFAVVAKILPKSGRIVNGEWVPLTDKWPFMSYNFYKGDIFK